jgi:transposase
MGHRHELTDEQWRRLEQLLPKARRGPQPQDLLQMVNAMLWLDKAGALLPGPAGALWTLAHSR